MSIIQLSSEDVTKYLPGPPFEKFIHFAFHGGARDILKKVHDVVPKHFIVEVAIHGVPG
jgi:hypothetical protein